jgi:hypothetical protein
MKAIIALGATAALIAVAVFLLWPGASDAHPLRDIDGVLHGSLEDAPGEFTALFFLGTSCPISRQYAPEIVRICEDFQSSGTKCYLVYPESGLAAKDLKEHLQLFRHKSPAILDTTHALVKKAGATVTPEAAVFSRVGDLVYRGRIDDLYLELGRQRREVRSHDLRDALTALAARKNVPTPRTQAVGCFIEGL